MHRPPWSPAHHEGPPPRDARRRGGGVRQGLAAGVVQFKPTTEVEATSILPSLKRQDYSVAAWYPSVYAPRTGGAYDSHHRTAGVAGRTRRRGRVATRGKCAAAGEAADRRVPGLGLTVDAGIPGCCLRTATARTWLDREPNR